VGRPMFIRNLRLTEKQFSEIMAQRKKEVPKFIIDSIKK